MAPEMAYVALVSLEQTINQVIHHHSPIIHLLTQLLVSIRERAVFLQSFLEMFRKRNHLEGQIIKVGNKAEDIIEYLLFDGIQSDYESMNQSVRSEAELERLLREVSEEIESICRVAECFLEQMEFRDEEPRHSGCLKFTSFSRRRYGINVIGFEDELAVILDRLTSTPSKLQVLPILGTGGIGKTTLTKLAYDNPLIQEHFDIRIWVTLSKEYSLKSIHSKLLASMNVEKIVDVKIHEDKIQKYLEGERYLIVIDNMWNKKAWDEMKMLFPDNHNGSRVVITTRLPDVAAYPDPSSPIHAMKLLNEEESWILLQRRVFGDNYCPLELEIFGRKIVKICEGLPLSIVLVAGLLSSISPTRIDWMQLAENNGKLETILWLSYTYLPPHMRACFLYMAGFPEDYEIPISELIKLWAAERFLQTSEHREMESVGEMCLDNLVDRGLVLGTGIKSDGTIKSCSLHDLVRDFCVRKVQQEKLLLPVMDYLPTPILRWHFLPQVLRNHRRLSLTSHDLNVKNSIHGSHIRTIICIQQRGYKSVGSIQNFKSLRVMHVLHGGNDVWDWEMGRVFNLIHLTYLASHIPTSIVPPTISLLQNLQSLIIYRFDVCLPVEIWRLRQLRHLIAFSFHSLPCPEEEDALPLEQLQTLSLVKESICSERMVKMIPNVKKLGICLCQVESYEGYNLYHLRFLNQLEKLKLEMCPFGPRLGYAFPLRLRKLTLKGSQIPWSDMIIVGSLPDLQVLKLRNYACDGDLWETNYGEFERLEVLLIDGSNLRHWKTESSHFPVLRHLTINHCPHLSGIPIDLERFQQTS